MPGGQIEKRRQQQVRQAVLQAAGGEAGEAGGHGQQQERPCRPPAPAVQAPDQIHRPQTAEQAEHHRRAVDVAAGPVDQRHQQGPQGVGEPLHPLADVRHQSPPAEQVFDRPEADERVVRQPAEADDDPQEHQRRQHRQAGGHRPVVQPGPRGDRWIAAGCGGVGAGHRRQAITSGLSSPHDHPRHPGGAECPGRRCPGSGRGRQPRRNGDHTSSPPARVVSPEVHPDRRVTFRLSAPKATEVNVSGIGPRPQRCRKMVPISGP